MELSHEEHRRRYEAAMEEGARQYADVLERLNTEGLPAIFTQTGGMNAALEVQLETGYSLLITDAEDSLSWRREDQLGWGVGLYNTRDEPTVDGGAMRFASTDQCSIEALLELTRQVLFGR